MNNEIYLNIVIVTESMNNDLVDMSNVEKDISPYMQLFLQEQKKSLSVTANGIRYHPMIIRFCLSIAAKSPSAYDELRSSNILTLPSRRTLSDYRNEICPKVSFSKEVILELKDLAENLVLMKCGSSPIDIVPHLTPRVPQKWANIPNL